MKLKTLLRGCTGRVEDGAQVGSVFLASVFSELRSEVITESVFTGMDSDPDLAVLKGLVEMTERSAFANGKANGFTSCKTERSDGFAAFPCGVRGDPKKEARKNAYDEAVERYVWARWWDDKNIGHKLDPVSMKEYFEPSQDLLNGLLEFLPVKKIYRVTPKIDNGADAVVAIFFALLEPYGVISGGAAGSANDIGKVNFRAICELFRHGLAIRKIKESDVIPVTFYERRLAYFGLTKKGSGEAESRLNHDGCIGIILPSLVIDEPVSHELSELVAVHRCFFDDQPPFIGGELERLCL